MGAESPGVAVRRQDCRCRAALRAQLSCSEQLPAHHPDIGQRKQRVQLGRVLGQATVANLEVTELALDHPEGVLATGPDMRLETLDTVAQPTRCRIAQRRRLPVASQYTIRPAVCCSARRSTPM